MEAERDGGKVPSEELWDTCNLVFHDKENERRDNSPLLLPVLALISEVNEERIHWSVEAVDIPGRSDSIVEVVEEERLVVLHLPTTNR